MGGPGVQRPKMEDHHSQILMFGSGETYFDDLLSLRVSTVCVAKDKRSLTLLIRERPSSRSIVMIDLVPVNSVEVSASRIYIGGAIKETIHRKVYSSSGSQRIEGGGKKQGRYAVPPSRQSRMVPP